MARRKSAPSPTISDEHLAAIRVQLGELFDRWDAPAVGDVLRLKFRPAIFDPASLIGTGPAPRGGLHWPPAAPRVAFLR
jgi:hypothetical protein